MGQNTLKQKSGPLPQRFQQKKRENHQIFGQVILIQNMQQHRFNTIKHIKIQQIHPYLSLYQKNKQKSLSTSQSNLISIIHINHNKVDNNFQPYFISVCGNQHYSTIVMQCLEIDLQSIIFSRFYQDKMFGERECLHLVEQICKGIKEMQTKGDREGKGHCGVYPIGRKSVFLESKFDQYMGEDIGKAIFKVVPMELVQPFCGIADNYVPPELKSNFSPSFHYNSVNQIYCLGKMILEIICQQQQNKEKCKEKQKPLDFSFGRGDGWGKKEIAHRYHNIEEKRIKILESANFSQQFISLIKMMIKENEIQRIGLHQILKTCKVLKQKYHKQIASTCQMQKQQLISNAQRSKRNISSIGLTQKDNQISSLNKAINIKFTKKNCSNQLFSDLTNKQKNLQRQSIALKPKPSLVSKLTNCQKKKQNVSSKSLQNQAIPAFYSSVSEPVYSYLPTQSFPLSQPSLVPLSSNCKKPNCYSRRVKFSNGAFYQGQFDVCNNFNGFGTLYYSQQSICYTGYWLNNRFHGFGYLFNQKNNKKEKGQQVQDEEQKQVNYKDFNQSKGKMGKLWQHYQGEFKFDDKDGYGILYFVDGSKFEGQFLHDKANGAGSFTKSTGQSINGIWQNNKLVKQY